ncbi:MAG: hypothetical protein JXQ90_00590 [Cyclobacteriaceae bacterium]
MNKLLLTIACLLGVTTSIAQFSKEEWHNGFLVTQEGDTVRGKIKYDMETNSLQMASRGSLKAYSSYNIFFFEIFDEIYKNYRQFYTLPFQYRSNYETPILFEVLYEGELSLLAREKVVRETTSIGSNGFYPNYNVTQNVLQYDFFFVNKSGKITYYQGSKAEILDIMSRKRDQIKKFIKKNRLKTDELKDLIRITSFYSSI